MEQQSPCHGESIPNLPNSPTNLDVSEGRSQGAEGPPKPPSDRRREKPQLSCNLCRRRKLRCDRQHPCRTCVKKGLALTCAYTPDPQNKGAGSVREHILQLEALVVSMMQQQQNSQELAVAPSARFTASPMDSFGESPGKSSPQEFVPGTSVSLASVAEDEGPRIGTVPPPAHTEVGASSSPSEHGSMRIHSHGANYVGSAHWAAVLDNISDLKDRYELEEEARTIFAGESTRHDSPSPRLLYEPVQANKAGILTSLPSRPVVDRLVSRYFNSLGLTPGTLPPFSRHGGLCVADIPCSTLFAPLRHDGKLANAKKLFFIVANFSERLVSCISASPSPLAETPLQYKAFWDNPPAMPIMWIGLLFSIMCLATQIQQSTMDPAASASPGLTADPDASIRVNIFREKTVQCLALGHYTKGGTYVLETLINYFATELLLCQDADIGLWILLGNVVQISLSMGYHRDPKHFPKISTFAGEMRRRVWATVVQLDLRISSQMGMPHIIKSQHCDTAEPRNLLDSDFDESTVELPSSRPETEATPVLYGLAKNRVDYIGGLISDLTADIGPYPYSEVMRLDKKLQDAQASLPAILRWQPLSQSVTVPTQIVMHRVWLELGVQRLVISLHKKHLASTRTPQRFEYSQNACLEAATKILEFQHLIDQETQPDGQLYPVHWMMSSVVKHNFLLGMSVLCYYIQSVPRIPQVPLDQETGERIRRLLRRSYEIWLRSSATSQEARMAVEHLSILLGLQNYGGSMSAPDAAASLPRDLTSPDEATWYTYQNAQMFGFDLMAMDQPCSASYDSMTEPQLEPATGKLNGWMTAEGIQLGET